MEGAEKIDKEAQEELRGRVKKNISKNLRKEMYGPVRRGGAASRFLRKFVSILYAVSLPYTMIFLSGNLIIRLPDVYSFELTRTLALKEHGMDTPPAQVADLISSYFCHGTNRFQTSQTVPGTGDKIPVFSVEDALNMEHFRSFIDVLLILGGCLLIVSALCFVFLVWSGAKKSLRIASYASMLVFLGSAIGIASSVYDQGTRSSFMSDFMSWQTGTHDVLPMIFGAGLRNEVLVASFVIALLLIVILHYLSMRCTRGYSMFRKDVDNADLFRI